MAVSLSLLGYCLVAASLVQAFLALNTYLSRRSVAQQNGCVSPPKMPQNPFLLGVDTLIDTISGFKNGRYLKLLVERHNRMGRTFYFKQFGATTIQTCDPDVLKAMLSTKFQDFGMGPLRERSLGPLLGDGIISADGAQWHHQRALIRPSFVKSQVADFEIVERHAARLINAIARSNYEVDLQEIFLRMILDAGTEYLFGESIDLLSENASETAKVFHETLDYAGDGTMTRLRLGKLMFLHRDPKFWTACKTVHAFADQYVAKALEFRGQHMAAGVADLEKEQKRKYVFLEQLALETDDPKVLRDQVVTLIMAARDTTSALLSFAFYLLSRHPEVWAKIRADVQGHYVEPMTLEALQEMTYIKNVLQEVLRLFPPLANNGRMALNDTVLPVGGGPGGKSPMFVAKGTVVLFSSYVMHRRVDLWGPDANEFRPDRWENKKNHGWEYMPFLAGPRICPGQHFAFTEASIVLARMAHAFASIESLDPNEWVEQWTLSVAPRDGVRVRLTPA